MNKHIFKSEILPKLSVVLILSLTMIIIAGCQKSVEVVKEEKITPVKTELVSNGNIAKTHIFSGYITPLKEVNISSKSNGEVNEVFFEVGQKVIQGDILFAIDTNNADNNIESLKNQLNSQLNQTESSLKIAKIQFDDAEKNLNDMTELYNNNSISAQQLEDAKVRFNQAKISYNSAQKAYDLLVNNSEKSSIAAQIDIAKDSLKDLEVKSPISGIVTQRNVEVGELAISNPAFKIANIDSVILKINIPETLINRITLNQVVNITISSMETKTFTGKINEISPVADTGTLTFPVKILIENKDGFLKPGMYCQAEIIGEKSNDTIIIPRNSILLDGEQRYVYIFEDGIAKRSNLVTGVDNGIEIEIKDGLKEGQSLIVKGQSYLTNGQKVINAE